MTECKFRLDISFLVVLFDYIQNEGYLVDNNFESHENYLKSIDCLF